MAELNEPTIERPLYMETLARFKDSHIIKILSGVRIVHLRDFLTGA
ncbi:MAG: hypothetical protein K6G80_03300 [Treponema sp.]|nr:hypothetical protein [Treponema sp.]